jgi:hypothetical protein
MGSRTGLGYVKKRKFSFLPGMKLLPLDFLLLFSENNFFDFLELSSYELFTFECCILLRIYLTDSL